MMDYKVTQIKEANKFWMPSIYTHNGTIYFAFKKYFENGYGIRSRVIASVNYNLDVFGWILKKILGNNTSDSNLTVIESILKRKNYVMQSYNGGTLYTNAFVYVIIDSLGITVGTDVNSHKNDNVGHRVEGHKITEFMIALKYFERI